MNRIQVRSNGACTNTRKSPIGKVNSIHTFLPFSIESKQKHICTNDNHKQNFVAKRISLKWNLENKCQPQTKKSL